MSDTSVPNNNFQEDFEDFFEYSLCGFLITDPKGIIIRGNTTIAQWTGISTTDLKGKRFTDLLTIGSKIYYETHLRPLLVMQGFFDEIVVELQKVEGTKYRILVNALERRNSDGVTEFIRYTLLKASDRLQYEKNLQQATANAEKEILDQKIIVNMREQLIAVLGHDLRNPLSTISMATEMLMQAKLEKEDKNVVMVLKRSSLRMGELISNIMDFARTRLGEHILPVLKETLLTPVLQQVIDELSLSFPQQAIITEFSIDEPVLCDADRIGQLLSNLLANAITHGRADTPVHVQASNKNGILQIAVCNEGDAIPEDFLHQLFIPFTREKSRPSQNGLGLGLYISSEIAKAHRGELTCTSNDEKTCFTFTMAV